MWDGLAINWCCVDAVYNGLMLSVDRKGQRILYDLDCGHRMCQEKWVNHFIQLSLVAAYTDCHRVRTVERICWWCCRCQGLASLKRPSLGARGSRRQRRWVRWDLGRSVPFRSGAETDFWNIFGSQNTSDRQKNAIFAQCNAQNWHICMKTTSW